jgi:DNA-binding MarR family transcriptional regulator
MHAQLMHKQIMRYQKMCTHAKIARVNDRAVVGEWRDLLAKHAAAWGALEHELGAKHDLGPSDFEVLDYMVEHGGEKLRVQELADGAHLSQSAVSRLVARLERSGLVFRAMCDVDRRGVFVCITEEGRARHAAAAPTHRAVLASVLGDPPD